jgi:hypothetical protein
MPTHRHLSHVLALLGIVICLAMTGCTASNSPPLKADPIRQRDEGYSLLYKLLADESNVDKLFIFKHADDPIAGLVKEIATFSQSAVKRMDGFKDADGSLNYDQADLPVVEQKVRDLIAGMDEKNLLLSSGKDFQAYLVFTQLQAMDYGAKLSKAMEDHETDPTRKAFLADVSERTGSFAKRLMDLLSIKS